MSIEEWKQNYYWIMVSIVLWSSMTVIVSMLSIIEMKIFYDRFRHKINSEVELPRIQSKRNHREKVPRDSSASNPSEMTKQRSITEEDRKKIKTKLVYIFPMLSYIFYVIFGALSVLFKLNLLMFEGCKYGEWMGVIFTTARLFMYLVFIWRLYIVYTDSFFAYNTCLIIAMAIIVVVWGYFNAFFNVYTTKNDILLSNGYTYCTVILYFPMVVSTVLYDMITCIFCCYFII
eukprot:UN05296